MFSRRGGSREAKAVRSASSGMCSSLSAVTIGACGMYFLDPIAGTRRRHRFVEQLTHLGRVTSRDFNRGLVDLQNQAQGIRASVRSKDEQEIEPQRLIARVRSCLGRVTAHPRAIDVSAENGAIVLRGPVLASDVDEVIAGVSRVRGVREVRNELEVHSQAEGHPALQGRGRRGMSTPLPTTWSPGSRLLTSLAGTSLLLSGLSRRGFVGTILAVSGGTLLLRSISNLDLRRLTGVGAGPRAVDVQKTLELHAALPRVFEFFSNYQNFPQFMQNVREIRQFADGRSHWVVAGPAGMDITWDAEVTRFVPNKVLAWRSVPGSMVENAGEIKFEPVDDQRCRVNICLSYNPLAGAIGHVVAKLFGSDPRSELNQDLLRAKTMIESASPGEGQSAPQPEARGAGQHSKGERPAEAPRVEGERESASLSENRERVLNAPVSEVAERMAHDQRPPTR